MASDYETFWDLKRYALVGNSKTRPFPKLTFAGLKRNGKIVYPVDRSESQIDGERTYASLAELPEPVDAVVIEVPKEEAFEWFKQAADSGVKDIWLHGKTETPECTALAKEQGIRLRSGTCAVMYLHRGFSPHAIHRFINRVLGKY